MYAELSKQHEEEVFWRLGTGFLSGSLAMLLAYPVRRVEQVAHHVGFTHLPLQPRVKKVLEQTRGVWRAEGLRGFFKGSLLALFVAGPAHMLQFILHDELLDALLEE